MFYRKLSFILSIATIALFGISSPTSAQKIDLKLTGEINKQEQPKAKTKSEPPKCDETTPKGAQRIQLYYYRQAASIKKILEAIPYFKNCLIISESPSKSNDFLILNGARGDIEKAYRVISSIDLPLPGIDLQMWGIQISSRDPQQLARVMTEVQEEINLTQQLLQETFDFLKRSIRDDVKIDGKFEDIITKIRLTEALSKDRPLSLIDIVLMGSATTDPQQFNIDLYNKLYKLMEQDKRYDNYLKAMEKTGRAPFDRFFRSRGLKPERKCEIYENPKEKTNCRKWGKWQLENVDEKQYYAKLSRKLILEFALQYGDSVANPDKFDPYQLQQTSNALNDRLQDTTTALNKDIEDFFVRPTLKRIQDRVKEFSGVDYAQVGRTTIASLNGVETMIASNSVSAFDITPPLKLSELLKNAEDLNKQIEPFIPTENVAGSATQLLVGDALPISRVIGLIGAFGEQDPVYRQLNTGINLTFTPSILRNMNSAELQINLTIADPVASGTTEEGVPPLSRIGQQTLKTSVYTQAVDFFSLSTFSNQSTLDGGYSQFPILGQIWTGLFGSIPGFGRLFSWSNPPSNVRHESLLLTNSYINPTSMGLALLYPYQNITSSYEDEKFCDLQDDVEKYIANQFNPSNNRDIRKTWDPQKYSKCRNSRQSLEDE